MIKKLLKNFNAIESNDKIFFFVLYFFPISLILGNLVINTFIFFFSLSFILNFKKNRYSTQNGIIYFFIFFVFSLIINLFFSTNFENSFPRVIKIFFIILLTAETIRIFKKYDEKFLKNIFFIWSLIFSVVLFDCVFEIIFGFNTLGFFSLYPGRIASFFGEELIVGAFVHGFALFFIGYLMINNSNNIFLGFCILSIIIISFLIGERSNFLKLFISVIIFSFVVIKTNYLNKIFSLLIILGLIFGLINVSEDYKHKYYYQIETLFKKNGITNFYRNSQYGAHYDTAIQIFYKYPLFGVGIKNFRFESGKDIYINDDFEKNNSRQATHPHQVHLEFLSETGIFGYFCFLLFISYSLIVSLKNYLRHKNIFQLASMIFILTSLLPLLPSGSFLSTFNSGIFWINYIIMIGLCRDLKFKF